MRRKKKKTAIVKKQNRTLYSPEIVTIVKNTIAPNLTDAELKLYFYECQRRKVHPLDRLIYPVVRRTQYGRQVTFQTSIDYLRARAESSGEYAGQDTPIFEEKDGKLISATVTVYRICNGVLRKFSATAYWDEYCPAPPNDFMWRKMPHTMLAKCAEALALRKAFPEKLAGLYTHEEMQQASNEISNASVPEIPQVTTTFAISDTGEVTETVKEIKKRELSAKEVQELSEIPEEVKNTTIEL